MHILNLPLCKKANQFNLTLLNYGRATVGKTWCGELKNPAFSFLYYVIDGSASLKTKNGNFELKKGNWYIIPSMCDFSYSCDSFMEHLYFHIKLHCENSLDLLCNFKAPLRLEMNSPEDFLFENLSFTNDAVRAIQIKSFLYDAVIKAVISNNIKLDFMHLSPLTLKAIEYINLNASNRITTSSLAEILYVSKSTLTKHFRKEMNMSVQEYLSGIVLFKASRLLLKNEGKISCISEHLGFSDQFYFSRCFKKAFGVTPREYRKTFSSH